VSAVHRFLAACAIGIAHFSMSLLLGPSIHCDNVRGCAATEWIPAPQIDVFALPLSLARESLATFFDGRSFAFHSTANSIAFGLLAWAALWIVSRARARFQ
jgi:hypothetical protein